MLDSLLRSEFVAKVAESEWVKKNITGKAITLQLQVKKLDIYSNSPMCSWSFHAIQIGHNKRKSKNKLFKINIS
jgi:hypothetical protein